MQFCFLHGLDSSPHGTKARLLKTRYPHCLIPSLPPDIHERVRIVERELQKPSIVIGSSLGGLTALMAAEAHPERVAALLLLAPAVGCRDESIFTEDQKQILESIYVPATIPTVIIAGIRDDVIPLVSIRALVQRSPDPDRIQLHEVDDDHNLHQSLGLMLESIEQIRKKLLTSGENIHNA
jgi:pimeloyl-ACP methyl ester carboxylesterase